MLRDDLQNSLKEAMKNKDMKTVGAVRLIIAGQKEKDVEARAKGLEKASDADLLAMMQTMIKQRNESIKIYNEGNRPDLAEKEQAEIDVINRFCQSRWMPLKLTKLSKPPLPKQVQQASVIWVKLWAHSKQNMPEKWTLEPLRQQLKSFWPK